jgi:tRNA pseudouridine38-40 synthase
MRYKLTLEYDGTPFVGWQRQTNGTSVQAVLEDAIFHLSGERVVAIAAGRTDAGVHALGQVAHVDLERPFPPATLRDGLNALVRPHPVAVLNVETAAANFHARLSAKKRHYLYRIVNRRAPLAVARGLAWQVATPLDAGAMHEAAQILVGRHDFSSFRASLCQARSAIKTLDRLDVSREGEEIRTLASARSFLQHQVRAMVGSLVLVGLGRWQARDLGRALEARERRCAGPNAPPEGLYLLGVDY